MLSGTVWRDYPPFDIGSKEESICIYSLNMNIYSLFCNLCNSPFVIKV